MNYLERGHGITAQTLHQITDLTRLTIRRRIQGFKNKGWIDEGDYAPDHRGTYYCPTEKIIDDIGPAIERRIDNFLK